MAFLDNDYNYSKGYYEIFRLMINNTSLNILSFWLMIIKARRLRRYSSIIRTWFCICVAILSRPHNWKWSKFQKKIFEMKIGYSWLSCSQKWKWSKLQKKIFEMKIRYSWLCQGCLESGPSSRKWLKKIKTFSVAIGFGATH